MADRAGAAPSPRSSNDSQRSNSISNHRINPTSPMTIPISQPNSAAAVAVSSAPRSPSMRIPSPHVGHRHSSSFSDTLRGMPPPSPRNSRHPSISSAGVQELLNNPPKPTDAGNPAFVGRDWHGITVGELVDPKDVHWVEVDTGIEDATNYLIESRAAVLLIRATPTDKAAVATFDYRDLNQYLLFATGSLRPDADHLPFYQDLAKKAQAGKKIPLREAKSLGSQEPFVMLPHTAKLTKVVEAFGGGVHRLIIVREWTNEVCGLLSQSHLVKFLWDNGKSFPLVEQLYPQTLQELGIGSQKNLISINGDRPLSEALLLMDMEGVSSLAVVDNNMNVVGNISTVDVKLLTKASSAPLLQNTCIHFISVILSSRGVADGQDSFPVFHIPPQATLAHAVAKLVATKSHRLWVTTPPSPAHSGPPTPSLPHAPPFSQTGPPAAHPAIPPSPSTTVSPPPIGGGPTHFATGAHAPPGTTGSSPPPPTNAPLSISPPSPAGMSFAPSMSAAALPGAVISGRLSGVVSLTDVLNVCARASGLHPVNPGDVRRGRRRSSSSSLKGSGSVVLSS